jgi:hypothetical protein
MAAPTTWLQRLLIRVGWIREPEPERATITAISTSTLYLNYVNTISTPPTATNYTNLFAATACSSD